MSNQRNPQAGSWNRVRAIAGLFAAALLIATACGSDSTASDAQDLIGSWSSDEGVTWEIGEGSILVTGGVVDEASIA